MRAMARDPSIRYHSAPALSAALSAALATAPTGGPSVATTRLPVAAAPPATVPVEALHTRRRPRYLRTWLLGALALVVLLGGAYAASDDASPPPEQTPTSSVAPSIPLPAPLEGPFGDLDAAVRP
jgi:hypothetical protein